MVPVLDVEVVALHVREYEPSQAEVLIERSDGVVPVEQRPVLDTDPVALGAHLRQRAAEILAGLESRDVVPQVRQWNPWIIDPGAVMVVEAVAVGVVEPRRLDRLPVGKPLLTGCAVR